MKRKPKESLFRRLSGFITRNFGLKLLSLALAIVIYEVLKPKANEHEYDTPSPIEQHANSN